jgi:WXG100 family type VII secretion target
MIKINPQHVRTVAGQFKQKSGESSSMASQLQSAVNGMEAEWEGLAKERFYGDFTQWYKQMQQYAQLLEGIGNELTGIANRIEEADRTAAGK